MGTKNTAAAVTTRRAAAAAASGVGARGGGGAGGVWSDGVPPSFGERQYLLFVLHVVTMTVQ